MHDIRLTVYLVKEKSVPLFLFSFVFDFISRAVTIFRELVPIPEFRTRIIYLFQRSIFDHITVREGEK
jgi:hypothetical protein